MMTISGNLENIILKALVKVLGLPAQKYLSPYKVG